jgi:hypothetical protein
MVNRQVAADAKLRDSDLAFFGALAVETSSSFISR